MSRLHYVGTWLSLVEHSLGVRGVGSSNLPVPTKKSGFFESKVKPLSERSGRGFFVVVRFVFSAPDLSVFSLAHLLRLQQVQRQGDAYVKSFAAEPAANRELQKRKSRNI